MHGALQCVGSRASFGLSGRLWFLPMVPALDNCKQVPYSIRTTVRQPAPADCTFCYDRPTLLSGRLRKCRNGIGCDDPVYCHHLNAAHPLVWACISALAVL